MDAKDVVQESLFKAFRVIAARLPVSHSRCGKPGVHLVSLDEVGAGESLERGLEPLSIDQTSPEAELMAKTQAEQSRAAIAKVSPEVRETLVVRDIQRLEYREIAQITGTPLGTVMPCLARAPDQITTRKRRAAEIIRC